MQIFYISATWLDVASLSLVIGMLTYLLWVMPGRADVVDTSMHDRLWSGLGMAVLLMAIASGVWLIARTMELSGQSGLGALTRYLPLVIDKTQYGQIWQLRMGLIGGIVVCWVMGALRPFWRPITAPVALLAIFGVVFTRSATGHAADHGIFTPGVWVDWLHVLSGCAWAGCFFVAALWVSPQLAKSEGADRHLAAIVYSRLSRVLEISLFLVASTGIYNAWRGGIHIAHVGQTFYGQVLIIKVALLMVMLWVGAHNRYVKLPALLHWVGIHEPVLGFGRTSRMPGWNAGASRYLNHEVLVRFSRAVFWESLISIGILLAAAILHHAMPPIDLHHLR